MESIKVLELFSGIGGMHFALKASSVSGIIVQAIDINPVANHVYNHNFPNTSVYNRNVQYLTADYIAKLEVDTILMSPPCQPFTRLGKMQDLEDSRTDAFVYICELIPKMRNINKILMENVKGFEISKARDLFLSRLKESRYCFQEFMLSPTVLGIPNTRTRYYCIANKKITFPFLTDTILGILPGTELVECKKIKEFIIPNDEEQENFLISDVVLQKRSMLMDICDSESTNSNCFTKAYTRYTEGTGSVYCSSSRKRLDEIFGKNKNLEQNNIEGLKDLKLRYFTPNEVSKIMSFPKEFSFPNEITNKQKYRLLGNSINVKVVSELIELLCK